MQIQSSSLSAWQGTLCLVIIVLLSALSALVPAPGLSAARAAAVTPCASVEISSPLLQFTAGGHVIGFAPTQVILGAFDHALRIEFIGTAGVMPMTSSVDAPQDSAVLTRGDTQALGAVTYFDLWPGISVEYRAAPDSIIKSTYTLAPGADATQLRLRYNLPAELQSDGSLQIRFGRGVISESAPLAWQEIDGKRIPVSVAFTTTPSLSPETGKGSEVSFRLGSYDPRYPLTIDPNYAWHAFYGAGPSEDRGYGIAVDGSGNIYIAGHSGTTWQGDNDTPPKHAHSGYSDIVVVKLNSAGRYQWHAFYGSDRYDSGSDISVDGSGNVYVTGRSRAHWQVNDSIDPKHSHSGGDDIFVMKLNSAGDYQWHTFYGSAANDSGSKIAVDGSGNAYVAGYSFASWQGDNNANPEHLHSGGGEIVVMKLDSAGDYQWHTFYGSGTGDFGYGVAVDESGNVYVVGSSDALWQGDNNANPKHPHSGSGNLDIVAVKLNSAGQYQWHTFYGSDATDQGYSIAADGSGSVYVTGESFASWQGDDGANPKHSHSENNDIVVVKLNSAGNYQWHTFYGSEASEKGFDIAVDANSNIHITGSSHYVTWQGDNSTNPKHPHSGEEDLVALKLNSAGAYQWHTFYGSEKYDFGFGIAVDGSGHVYVVGSSEATWQGDGGVAPKHPHGGDEDLDIVVLKLSPKFIYLPLLLRGN